MASKPQSRAIIISCAIENGILIHRYVNYRLRVNLEDKGKPVPMVQDEDGNTYYVFAGRRYLQSTVLEAVTKQMPGLITLECLHPDDRYPINPERVKQLLGEGMSQAQVATELGTHQSIISRIVTQYNLPYTRQRKNRGASVAQSRTYEELKQLGYVLPGTPIDYICPFTGREVTWCPHDATRSRFKDTDYVVHTYMGKTVGLSRAGQMLLTYTIPQLVRAARWMKEVAEQQSTQDDTTPTEDGQQA